jgi:hypothetical protein
MPIKIFFSWQVDTPALGSRNLIERALERAAANISEDTSVEEAIREDVIVDRDTKGVGASRRLSIRSLRRSMLRQFSCPT